MAKSVYVCVKNVLTTYPILIYILYINFQSNSTTICTFGVNLFPTGNYFA